MVRKKKDHEQPETDARTCAMQGCAEPGLYKAPLSREALREYQWLCLEHIREFNRSWDYFKGMPEPEIDAFRHDALTGHRPTWQREAVFGKHAHRRMQSLEEGLARFLHWDSQTKTEARRSLLPDRERKALATLDLEDRVTVRELKAHYRKLVKKHHPDLHGGKTEQEEAFKRINAAYAYLLKTYEGQ
jgi:DnaJ domain